MRIFIICLIISFSILFSACQEEEELEMQEEEQWKEVILRSGVNSHYLTLDELRTIFKFDATLDVEKRAAFIESLHNFLLRCAPFRKVVYAIYQEIGYNEDKKVTVTINPSHSGFDSSNPYALYDYEKNAMIFSTNNDANNSVLVIHELIHHWQKLVGGKRVFYHENLRNTEFEVVFLLDAMVVHNQGDGMETDEDLIQYFGYKAPQTPYTKAEKQEYLAVVIGVLSGNISMHRDDLERFARNYKGYSHVGYTPNWGFPIIERLLDSGSSNYIP